MERVDYVAKIYIDAGHGGHDGGAVGNGIKEKDIVLDIAKRVKAGLEQYKNTSVLMTRENDTFLSLSERTKKANNWNADLLLSIHINGATNKSAKGFETFVYNDVSSGTVAFQNVLHAEIMRAMGSNITDRGKKRANFHMVRESKMKAVLTENLFISNASDANLLKSADFRQKVANGHISGVVKFLGLQKERNEEPEEPDTGELFKVQVGAFGERNNAEALVRDLEKRKYSAFIVVEEGFFKVQAGAFSKRSNAEELVERLRKDGYRPYIKLD